MVLKVLRLSALEVEAPYPPVLRSASKEMLAELDVFAAAALGRVLHLAVRVHDALRQFLLRAAQHLQEIP